jgi:hypothetical protein
LIAERLAAARSRRMASPVSERYDLALAAPALAVVDEILGVHGE